MEKYKTFSILFFSFVFLLFSFSLVSAYGYDSETIKLIQTNVYYNATVLNITTTISTNIYNITTINNFTVNDTDFTTYGSYWTNQSKWIEDTYSRWFYNMTDPFTDWQSTFEYDYNQTVPAIDYADDTFIPLTEEANLNVNSSDYWDDMDSFNATQMEDNGGVLNIIVSWLESLFYTKNDVDINFAPINYGDDWNKTYADTLYLLPIGFDAENITSGTIAIARLPTLTNTHTLAYQNITGTQQAGCTNSDFLKNITMINGVLSSTCSAPAGGGGSNYTKYTSTGVNTWTKPASGTWVRVQLWAGGGAGGQAGAADAGGGGGGGGYAEYIFAYSDLGTVENCSVGAGGVAPGTNESDGPTGQPSNFTKNAVVYIRVYGGGGGEGASAAQSGGGGGGGIYGAGTVGSVDGTGGVGGIGCGAAGAGVAAGAYGFECGGGGGTTVGGYANWGGGGGGLGEDSGTSYSGGNSVWGGGGGAGGDGINGPEGTGGTSVFGGAGGAGNFDAGLGGNGTQPGGGGGGTEANTAGSGGNGQCIITVW